MHATTIYVIIFSFLLAALAVKANIGDFDDYWKQRKADARAHADAAYSADPEADTQDFNAEVYKIFESGNNTRRELRARKHNEVCTATNPIDRCWRCRKNWANERKRLAGCAKGFGRNAKGGKDGEIYVVTSPVDTDVVNPKPGTLRHAVIQNRPLWIIFARSMVIRLTQELMINSYKTIDGRGADVHIAGGAGLTIQYVHNVIIHGLRIHHIVPGSGGSIRSSESYVGFRTMSDGDGISVFGSSKIWIDHVSMSHCTDGLVDVIEASTAITISNCHFTNHDHVLLFGANDGSDKDRKMQITVAFNHFGKGLVQRMPRCRFGFFHVVNNDYRHWLMYAIGGSQQATIISEGNRYTASGNGAAKEVTKRIETGESEWKDWIWRSDGDLLRNGAFFVESGAPGIINKFKKKYSTSNMIKFKPGKQVARLTRFAGALTSKVGQKC